MSKHGGLPTRPGLEQTMTKGTSIYHVRNLELAVCLFSIGVPLRKDPPYTHVSLKNGEDHWTFHFESCDKQRQLKTQELIKAFTEDMAFIEKNPLHPMTFAMCALKNLESFKQHVLHDIPYVGYKAPGGTATLWVKKGSKKEANCLAKKMIRVNPGE